MQKYHFLGGISMNKTFIILSSVFSWTLWGSEEELALNVKDLIKDHYFVEAREKLKEISNKKTYLELSQLFTETVNSSLEWKYKGWLKFYKEHEEQGYTNTSLKTDLVLLKKLKKINPVGEIELCIFDKFIPQYEQILKEKASKIDGSLKLKLESNIVLSTIKKNIEEFQNRTDVTVTRKFLVNNLDVVKNLEKHNFEEAKKSINSFNQEHIKNKLTKELNESYKNSIKDRFEKLASEMSRFAKSDNTNTNTKQFYEERVLAIKNLTKETARGEEEKTILEVEIPEFVKKIEGGLNYWKQEEESLNVQIEKLKDTLLSSFNKISQNSISIICTCSDINCTINQLNNKHN